MIPSINLGDLCQVCKNWFTSDKDMYFGTFEVKDGQIAELSDKLQDGQYFRIIDSTFNDGVYQYPVHFLQDELFEGSVWAMKVPQAFIRLVDDINNWIRENEEVLSGPYESESFDGYSYKRANAELGAYGAAFAQFGNAINRWRKIR